jgi:ATP-dependent RNA helicase RhlE
VTRILQSHLRIAGRLSFLYTEAQVTVWVITSFLEAARISVKYWMTGTLTGFEIGGHPITRQAKSIHTSAHGGAVALGTEDQRPCHLRRRNAQGSTQEPATGFDIFDLHPSITAGVRDAGYVAPTPIQVEAIPHIMRGRDLIGLAQTGTGKTAAFLLPILHRLLRCPRGRVGALIISPTRELAEQTYETATDLGRLTGLRSLAIYGGVGIHQQTETLRNGVEIAVACPGRLIDHLWQGTFDPSYVEVLVIDEADRMFDMGFLPDIRKILKCLLRERQTLLFSATMPRDVRQLVQEILRNPVTVQIGHMLPATSVSHTLYPVRQHLKTALLKGLLRRTSMESVLVFARTKHRAERVAQQLIGSGYRAASLQGDLSQYQRQAALDGFRAGSVKILVATDIVARGIDVLSISHVINYDMPDTTDAYTHRIGRTGRIGATGEAFTFVTNEDLPMVRALENLLNASMERRTLDGFDYGASPAHSEGIRPPHRLQGRAARNQRIGIQ